MWYYNIALVCYKNDTSQNTLFFRSSFWKFNFLAITEEREIYLIISISKQCMESHQFPSTYTVISGLLNNVDNSKLQNFELCHCCSKQAIASEVGSLGSFKRVDSFDRVHPENWLESNMFFIYMSKLLCNHIDILICCPNITYECQKHCVKNFLVNRLLV